jgi:hypothetical protein
MADNFMRESINFLNDFGLYDVVLPFLLVFTIVFAILEKTKILGTAIVEGQTVTMKNQNAMVAFVMSFLVIASTQLVSIINTFMANVVLIILLIVSFMMLVGTFYGSESEFTLKDSPGWMQVFTILIFAGISLIFLDSMDWLQPIISVFTNFEGEWASSLVFLVVLGGFIWFITREEK